MSIVYAVDLHSHTRFFHGRRDLGDLFDPIGVRALAWTAGRRGLDAVATTNHDYYTPFEGVAGADVLPGIEITTTRGHVLVVGPDPPAETPRGELTPAEAVEIAHERGCAAIVAHPYRNSTVREVDDVPFDAIEVNGKHPRTQPLVEELADSKGLPLVGGSDAHYPFEVGRAFTLIEADELTPETIVAAIRSGDVEPRVVENDFNRLLQRGYRVIHRKKRYFESSEPTPGVGTPPGEESIDGEAAMGDQREG